MGYNATVVVMMDSVDTIGKDPNFGKKLKQACMSVTNGNPVDVSAESGSMTCVNAATVIEDHHADSLAIVAIGGNHGRVLGYSDWKADDEQCLKDLADKMGYRLVKKAK